MSILKIVIKGQYFDEIKAGRKKVEYRDATPFWTSRLLTTEGKKRVYQQIEFINGYNKDARRMITEFNGFSKKGDLYHIVIGKILKK